MKNIEALKAENKRLQEAVNQQTSELLEKNRALEIEASLEKVRTVAMGMKKPEDMLDVCRVISAQLQHFGVSNIRNIQTAIIDENIGQYLCYQYFTSYDKTIIEKTEYLKSPVEHEMVNQMLASRNAYFTNSLKGKELDEFRNHRKNENHFPDPLLDETSELEYCFLSIGRGGLGLTLYSTLDEAVLNLFKRFHEVFSLAYQRFRDIQKAEDQAKEARIEAALERLRSRSLAMQKSEELAEASVLLEEEIRKLGIENWGCAFHIYDEETKSGTPWDLEWFTSMGGLLPFYKTPRENVFLNYYEESKKGKPLYIQEFGPEVIKEHYDYLKSLPVLGDALTELHNSGVPLPERQIDHVAFFNHGHLLFITYKPVPEAHAIFIRFAKAFNQAYTRFLDLQKAEEQAREAEIELALERVRSRSLAMHATSELQDVIHTVHQELLKLDIGILGGSFIAINNEIEEELHCWGSGGTADTSDEVHIPYFDKPFYTNLVKGLKSGPAFFTEEFTQEEKKEFFTFLFTQEPWSNLKANEKQEILSSPGGYTRSCSVSAHTSIFIINQLGIKFSEEENDILKRFAKVFEQTYTRFLDLQKAEAQAREAQIEAALERIRSRSLAMYKTDDLREVVAVLFEQMQGLSVDMGFASVSIFVFEDGSRDIIQWIPTSVGVSALSIPYFDHPISSELFDAKENGADYFAKIYTLEEKNSWLEAGFELTDYKELPDDFKASLIEAPGYAISITLAKNSGICIPSFVGTLPSSDDVMIMKRVGKVFEQAYIRFLDLQKAETQAKEAKIEASLERVRSRSMAMHKTDELQEVVRVVAEELKNTGVILDTWGAVICTYFQDSKDVLHWTASENPDNPSIAFLLPYFKDELYDEAWASKNRGDSYFAKVFSFDVKNAFFKHAFEHSDYRQLPDDYKKLILESESHGIAWAWSKNSAIMIPSIQGDLPSEGEKEILIRFVKVFEQSFIRFLDLQKAEAQAREARIEAALEKVRSRSLAMHKSDELNEVVSIVFEKLKELQIPATAVGIGIAIEGSKDLDSYVCGENEEGLVITNYRLPHFDNPIPKDLYNALEKQMEFFVANYSKAEKDSFYNYVIEHTAEFKHLPEDILDMIFDSPTYTISMVAVKNAVFNINDFEGKVLRENEIDIIKRFAKVFDQAYTRFLDLQKAEAQAREARIEAALERVRSRSLAMHKTEELADAIGLLQRELAQLEFALDNCIFWIIDKESNEATIWVAPVNNTNLPEPYQVPFTNLPYFREVFQAWELRNPKWTYVLEDEDKKRTDEYLFNHTGFRNFPDDVKKIFLLVKKTFISISFYKYGGLHVSTEAPINELQREILSRFSKVFDQTYTRFLDLQKAEAQAREAQISLAVERVRARALAMFKSDEILEVVFKLKEEIMRLDIPGVAAAAILLKEKNGKFRSWDLTSFEMNGENMHLPLDIPFEMEKTDPGFYLRNVWKEGSAYSVIVQDEKSLQISCNWLREHHKIKEAEEAEQFLKSAHITKSYHPTYPLNQGRMILDLLEPPSQEIESILSKLGGAFDLAYKRFEDLEKAEAQAKQARIESALERIRGQVASMRESSELLEIMVSMRKEFVDLGHEAHYFWHMRWLPDTYEKAMTSGDGTQVGMVMSLPRQIHGDIKAVADWEKGKDPLFVLAMEAEEAVDYVHKMITWGDFEQVDPQAPSLDDVRHIGGLTFIMARTTHGEIGYSLPGSVPNPPQESLDTLVRFAKVFGLAYKRFEDLKKAEHQARETLIELALERVRSRSMGMQKSEELQEVIQVVYQQFIGLGIPIQHTGFIMDYKNREDMNIWLADSNQFHSEITFPFFDSPHWNSFVEAKAKGEDFFTNLLDFDAKNSFYNVLFEFIPDLTKEKQDFYFAQEGLSISTVLLDNVGLYIENYTTTPFTEEENRVLMRFGKVFQQTYTRFLDLQKAEKQALVAKIEASLERVRAQTMAMHNSEDVGKCIVRMFEELTALGVNEKTRFGIGILNHQDENNQLWTARKEGGEFKLHIGHLEMSWHPLLKSARKAWKAQDSLHRYILEGEDLVNYYQMLNQAPDYKIQIDIEKLPEREFHYGFVFEHGFFYAFCPDEFSQDNIDLIHRFSAQFAQTYRRYLDLKKAEAQAKEAKIEAALEKVRSRTMGMQHSDELPEAANVLFTEVRKLGIPAWSCGYNILSKDLKSSMCWMSSENEIQEPFRLPLTEHESMLPWHEAITTNQSFFVYEQGGEDLVEHYRYLGNLPELKSVFAQFEAANISLPTFQVNHLARFEQGFLLFITYERVPEEHTIFQRFTKVFEQTYTRFLDLQKAEAQAKESKIEAALERIRSRSLAMHHSSELSAVVDTLLQEFTKLEFTLTFCIINLIDEQDMSNTVWAANPETGKDPESYYMKFEDYPFHHAMWDAWKSQKKRFIYTIEGEEKKIYDEYLYSETEFRRFPKHVQDANKALERYVAGFTFFKFSGLQTVSEDYISEDDLNILERFGRVFEQAYTRFLDLQKAEAQAREAQIEAALERVRSRTLGMQKAEELGDVATVLFGELNTLVENLWTCGFVLCEKDSKEDEWWLSLDNGLIQPFSLPNEGDFAHKTLYEGWEKGESYRTVTLENKQLQEHYEWLMNLPVAKQIFEEMEDSGIPRPKWQRLHAAYFKTGYLVIITEVPCPEEDIFKRFAQVFDLTYTRFLDLTKAEAQAKEAKLELSLQRIRAQVTSMTHSDELFDIVVSMRKEFISLGNEADYFWHMKWTPANYEMSMTSEDGERVGMIISVPKFVHDEIPRLAEWEKSDSPLIALDLNGKEAWDYMDKMNTYGKYEQADPHAPSEEDILAIGGLTFVVARTTHGEIGFSLTGQVPNPPKESLETLIRFAAVFDLAYRRFEDLLTAEKQNRKAKIELALERVRARAMAMQAPEELIEVAQVMREEMGVLGVEELETSSIYLNKDTTGKAECWYSIKDIRDGAKTYLADHFDLSYQDTWVGRQMLNFYQSEESKTSILMKGENRVEWINYCAKKSPKLQGYYGNEIPERTYHLTKFSNGAIGAATPGEISGESWDLLRRAALVFSLAYSRFKDLSQARDDLKSLKKAKAKAEKALKELKSAQEQLVQQEKLASLGQLTAGIAHEIKNPLNFVNNFSDLSRELIEEVFEELENLADSETKQEIIAILNDVRSNLTKVHEHGSRADGIVTSMLQHSRASGNKSESKAINPIIKEFVNLSFHGMRAAKSPINVTIDLQLGEEVGNLNIVSEDFSRVILNLCNNAFDAMRDKLNAQPIGTYEAKLMVTSYCSNRKIILEFKDNGPGIPKENIDKILQPFFTTKKGTAGTGLGLSITHDIIKAHRGNLQIKSTVGEGTTMSIILPIDSE